MSRQEAAKASLVGSFADTFDAIVTNVSKVIQGKSEVTRLGPGLPGFGGPPPARGCTGRRQNHAGQGPGPLVRPRLPAHPVHPGPTAFGRHRDERLRPGHFHVQLPARAGVRQRGAGGRDQPGVAEDAVRPPRGHAGGTGHGGQRDALPAVPVSRHSNAEPGRARGYLPPAGEPAGSIPPPDTNGLSGPQLRSRDARCVRAEPHFPKIYQW